MSGSFLVALHEQMVDAVDVTRIANGNKDDLPPVE
jgi:hypothetical protein